MLPSSHNGTTISEKFVSISDVIDALLLEAFWAEDVAGVLSARLDAC